MIVSVTRLHTRRWRFLLPFAIEVWRTARQAQRSAGFLNGTLAVESPLVFWTFTVWTDEQAMRAFRNTAPHMKAMVRLLDWCDEASYVHWQEQKDQSVPQPTVAFERLRAGGKLSKVNHPSATHAAGRTTASAEPRPALILRPASRERNA
jgi:quinol monooxygenase YgiN